MACRLALRPAIGLYLAFKSPLSRPLGLTGSRTGSRSQRRVPERQRQADSGPPTGTAAKTSDEEINAMSIKELRDFISRVTGLSSAGCTESGKGEVPLPEPEPEPEP